LLTLGPEQWLNEEAITAFLSVLVNSKPGAWFYTTDFFTKALLPQGAPADTKVDVRGQPFQYEQVKEFGNPNCWRPWKTIFDLERLFIPINVDGNHWTCAYLHFPTHQIYLYDSIGKHKNGLFYKRMLKGYIADEYWSRHGHSLPPKLWTFVPLKDTKGPKQRDAFNCGVFVCMIAELIINQHIPCDNLLLTTWELSEEDLNKYRRRITATILRGNLPTMVHPVVTVSP
jgi:Ulp1 family protease